MNHSNNHNEGWADLPVDCDAFISIGEETFKLVGLRRPPDGSSWALEACAEDGTILLLDECVPELEFLARLILS